MNYIQATIKIPDVPQREILITQLSQWDYEGFEEKDDALLAFIPENFFNEALLLSLLNQYNLDFQINKIEKTNWNKQWEEHFQPVIVEDFCSVRADFHEIKATTPYEIIITPKMSFGTGHHTTTQLMMRMMKDVNFQSKKVLDFGTGTGILAILAEKLGAEKIIAIDNDEWSYENSKENAQKNSCEKISFLLGSVEDVVISEFQLILANINRHILLQYMHDLYLKTAASGLVLMSGLLYEDKEIIINAAINAGFSFISYEQEHNWIALKFIRQ